MVLRRGRISYPARPARRTLEKEIRDEGLYKEDGFETWERYCRERWEWSSDYALKLITAAEYRQKLPNTSTIQTSGLASGKQEWSERSVREFTRIPDKQQAARVAAKVVKAVEQSEKEAAKNQDAKPIKLTAATVLA